MIGPDDAHGRLSTDEMLDREEEVLRGIRGDMDEDEEISVAFSGGGIRAACFDAGVLWKLADVGALKHVKHLAAVSGGSYTATAFASQVVAEADGHDVPSPEARLLDRAQADDFYMSVVRTLILRMQGGVGYYVSCSEDWLKGIKDAILFGLVVLGMLCVVPFVIFALSFVVAELLEYKNGGHMRQLFCQLELPSNYDVLTSAVSGDTAIFFTATWASAAMVVAGITWLPLARSRGASDEARYAWRSFSQWGSLYLLAIVAIFLLELLVNFVQLRAWQDTTHCLWPVRSSLCCHYAASLRAGATGSAACNDYRRTDNVHVSSPPWFDGVQYNATSCNATMGDPFGHAWARYADCTEGQGTLGSLLLVILVGAGLISIFVQIPSLVFWIVTCVGPLICGLICASIVIWRTFGPLTGQSYWFFFLTDGGDQGRLAYTKSTWNSTMIGFSAAAVAMLPYYNYIIRFMHFYLRSRMISQFYANREDIDITEAAHPMMPNLIIGCTLNDYQQLEDTSRYSVFTMTPHWMGCTRTKYCAQEPGSVALSRAMALSGGAVDALILTTPERSIKLRVWLQLLNLSMGDWVDFPPKSNDTILGVKTNTLPFVACFAALYVVATTAGTLDWHNGTGCDTYRLLTSLVTLFLVVLFNMAINSLPSAQKFISHAPLMRHIQQMVSFCTVSPEPPPYLYLSDGGMTEDLGLLHLLRRKAKWMLVADAGDDAELEMLDLRSTMASAAEERLCSFYALDDPRRGVDDLIETYRTAQQPYLRLGVRYGWGDGVSGQEVATGVVFVVRLRMPKHAVSRVVAPVIDEGELHVQAEKWQQPLVGEECDTQHGLSQAELGGCLCDCCHERLPVCTGFPNVSTANQFFTPKLFANYCRLGFELADSAVDELLALQRAARGGRRPAAGAGRVHLI